MDVKKMISVIIPVFKVESYLHQCVDSVLNQSYSNLEILLIDDGSPDHCGEICNEYAKRDERIKVFHTNNKGLSAARNLGLREAKGEYIGFVDSDDWIELDMYEDLIRKAEETDAEICICGFWYESGISSKESCFTEAIFRDSESIEALIDFKINNVMWNKLFRKKLFERLFFSEGKFYEDIDIMCRVLSRSKTVSVIETPKYHYRQREDSISKTYTAQVMIDYAYACVNRYFFLKEMYQELFYRKMETIIRSVVEGISRVWRWWYSFNTDEKQKFKKQIKQLKMFTKKIVPLFGYKSWAAYLRVSAFFMHSDSRISFALLYYMNQLFSKIRMIKRRVRNF